MYGKIWEFEKSLHVANGKQPFILLKSASFLLNVTDNSINIAFHDRLWFTTMPKNVF